MKSITLTMPCAEVMCMSADAGSCRVMQEVLKQVQEVRSGKAPAQASLEITKAEPFISGTFEYGVGRPAAGRKVYLFVNKAQDHRNLHDAMVQFLGVYKTNKKVPRFAGAPVPVAYLTLLPKAVSSSMLSMEASHLSHSASRTSPTTAGYGDSEHQHWRSGLNVRENFTCF